MLTDLSLDYFNSGAVEDPLEVCKSKVFIGLRQEKVLLEGWNDMRQVCMK